MLLSTPSGSDKVFSGYVDLFRLFLGSSWQSQRDVLRFAQDTKYSNSGSSKLLKAVAEVIQSSFHGEETWVVNKDRIMNRISSCSQEEAEHHPAQFNLTIS